MGNYIATMSSVESSTSKSIWPKRKYEPVETFQFLDTFPEESNNGLYFNDTYIPEEVLMMVLSHIDPKQILKATLVCKKWCNIIKSNTFWGTIYTRHYNKKAKKLPWYVFYCLFTTNYFDKNLLKNGNGQNKYQNWTIVLNFGDGFQIEDPPAGADPLPNDVPEFNGSTSCFATSYGECNKLQEISFEDNRLVQLILNQFKPHIYLSEWVAARFDCGCTYSLWCRLLGRKLPEKPKNLKSLYRYGNRFDSHFSEGSSIFFDDEFDEPLHVVKTGRTFEQWSGATWSKIELVLKDYPCGVRAIIFEHQGVDTQYWKGHYGSKMAGGVLKLLFDSMEPNV